MQTCQIHCKHCKQCNSENIIKNGKYKVIQKYKCKDCKRVFTEIDGRTKEAKKRKLNAIFVANKIDNISTEKIALMFKKDELSIIEWIKKEIEMMKDKEHRAEMKKALINNPYYFGIKTWTPRQPRQNNIKPIELKPIEQVVEKVLEPVIDIVKEKTIIKKVKAKTIAVTIEPLIEIEETKKIVETIQEEIERLEAMPQVRIQKKMKIDSWSADQLLLQELGKVKIPKKESNPLDEMLNKPMKSLFEPASLSNLESNSYIASSFSL